MSSSSLSSRLYRKEMAPVSLSRTKKGESNREIRENSEEKVKLENKKDDEKKEKMTDDGTKAEKKKKKAEKTDKDDEIEKAKETKISRSERMANKKDDKKDDKSQKKKGKAMRNDEIKKEMKDKDEQLEKKENGEKDKKLKKKDSKKSKSKSKNVNKGNAAAAFPLLGKQQLMTIESLLRLSFRGQLSRAIQEEKVVDFSKCDPLDFFQSTASSSPPLLLVCKEKPNEAIIGDGNHRIAALKRLRRGGEMKNLKKVEVTVRVKMIPLNDFDSTKMTAHRLDDRISKIPSWTTVPDDVKDILFDSFEGESCRRPGAFEEIEETLFVLNFLEAKYDEQRIKMMIDDPKERTGAKNWLKSRSKSSRTGRSHELPLSILLMSPSTKSAFMKAFHQRGFPRSGHYHQNVQKASTIDDSKTAELLQNWILLRNDNLSDLIERLAYPNKKFLEVEMVEDVGNLQSGSVVLSFDESISYGIVEAKQLINVIVKPTTAVLKECNEYEHVVAAKIDRKAGRLIGLDKESTIVLIRGGRTVTSASDKTFTFEGLFSTILEPKEPKIEKIFVLRRNS